MRRVHRSIRNTASNAAWEPSNDTPVLVEYFDEMHMKKVDPELEGFEMFYKQPCCLSPSRRTGLRNYPRSTKGAVTTTKEKPKKQV